MSKFTDANGNVWAIVLDLGLCRKLARTIALDVMNPEDYHALLCSLSARLEYAYAACRERAAELDVESLEAFGKCLGNQATACSDALQEALIVFYQSLGQNELQAQAEANLKVMQAARMPAEEVAETWQAVTEEHLEQMHGSA